jgi:hypothetical protein
MEENTEQQNQKAVENENMAKAKSEIEEIVKKYNISLVPVVMHHGDKTFSRIDILSNSTSNEEAN